MTNLEKYIGKTLEKMTLKDWQKVEDAIENFSGKQANMEKIRNFQKTLKLAKKLKTGKLATASYPAPDHMHAGVYMDFPVYTSLEGEELAIFREMLQLSDEFSLSTVHPKDLEGARPGITRVSFSFHDVWESDF